MVYLVVLAYATQKMILLVNKDDPEITTVQTRIHLNVTEPVNLAENGFDIMIWLQNFNQSTYQVESVEIPSDIGHFRMVHYEKGDPF